MVGLIDFVFRSCLLISPFYYSFIIIYFSEPSLDSATHLQWTTLQEVATDHGSSYCSTDWVNSPPTTDTIAAKYGSSSSTGIRRSSQQGYY